MQRDPVVSDTGRSPYEYCWSNPVNWIDPDGREPSNEGKTAKAREERSEQRIAGLIPLILQYANEQCRKDLAMFLLLKVFDYVADGNPDRENSNGGYCAGKRSARIYERPGYIESLWSLIKTICHEAHHAATDIRNGGKPLSGPGRENDEGEAKASADNAQDSMNKNMPPEVKEAMEKADADWMKKEKVMRDHERATGTTPATTPR